MTVYALLIAAWAIAQLAIGVWAARRVRSSGDFFVAGRNLPASGIFATFLAANIGAGSTVAATGYAYEHGLAAWWWNGSAGIGTLILAFWVGPRLWRIARDHNLYTAGDYIALRYSEGLRGLTALFIWLGSFFILSGQLIGGAAVLYSVFGWPAWLGGLVTTAIAAIYFGAGGLLGSAWVHRVQIVVIVIGLGLAAFLAASTAGGWDGIRVANADRLNFWQGVTPDIGWPLLFLLGPSFFLSPGLVQRAFAARDERALRNGIAISGAVLMIFAIFPVMIGMAARAYLPAVESPNMALPEMLRYGVPAWVGALALAAVFAAELSSADAVLFMLSTSGARDLYRRFVKPSASDAEQLRVVRIVAVLAAIVGYVLIFVIGTVGAALQGFYSVMVVSLFMPILATLLIARPSTRAAYASVIAGTAALAIVTWLTAGNGYGWATPVFIALLASAAAFFVAQIAGGNGTRTARI